MNKIRLFEAFAGYGSQAMALKRLGVPFESVGFSEIDQYAIRAYKAVHGDVHNYGDIELIDWNTVPDFDLFTYSFPCQDISTAGKQKGFEKGSGTRSALLWRCQKPITVKRPKYCVMENVKPLMSEKFLPLLREWEDVMYHLGYSSSIQILNSKDYGIPQNRERCFMVSIYGDEFYHFPEPFALEKRLKDVLEPHVDEKYYLSKKMVEYFVRVNADTSHSHKFKPRRGDDVAFAIRTEAGQRVDDNYVEEPKVMCEGSTNPSGHGMNGSVYNAEGIAPTITTNKGEGPKIIQVANIDKRDTDFNNPQRGRVYDPAGICPTIDTMQRGGSEPKIIEPHVCAMRGRNPENPSDRSKGCPTEQRIEVGGEISNCLTSVYKDNLIIEPRYGNSRVQAVVDEGLIDPNKVQFIDAYNKRVMDDVANTIKTTVDSSCMSFITEPLMSIPLQIPQATEQGYIEVEAGGVFDGSYIKSKTRRGRVQEGGKVSPALTAQGEILNVYEGVTYEQQYRIRKLTPRECGRLMGVDDEDIDKMIAAKISNTQLYKMFGNSIVVDVLYHIFRKLLVDKGCESQQLSLF